jgi:hypothetical protein
VEPFEQLVEAFAGRDDVTVGGGRGFGAGTLQVDGRIFAMSSESGLVLKLPRDRVAELVTSGDANSFDAGKGRPMKEWVVIPRRATARWLPLAEEALAFVGRR